MSVSSVPPPPPPSQSSLRSKMVRQIEKPRPLLKHSTSLIQPPVSPEGSSNKLGPIEAVQSPEDCLALLGTVIQSYQQSRLGPEIQNAIVALNAALKIYGTQMEAHYKDQLHSAMFSIQKACKDDRLTLISRIYLLEIVELRAMEWKMDENVSKYYKQKLAHLEMQATLENASNSIKRGLKTDRSVSLNAEAPQFIPSEVNNLQSKPTNDLSKTGMSAFKDDPVIQNLESGRGHLNGISVSPKTESEKYQDLVHIGQEKIRISGDSLELVQAAKIVLNDFFTTNPNSPGDPSSSTQNTAHASPSSTKHVGVVRQPLFPAATKEAFSAAKSSNLVENRRSQFAKTSAERLIRERMDEEKVLPKPSFNIVPEDLEEKVSSSSPSKAELVYDRDVILKIADAPLSQVKPFNWNDILAEFPCLERKHVDFKDKGRHHPYVDLNLEPSPVSFPKKDLTLRDRLDFPRPQAEICVWNDTKGEWVVEMSPVESQTNPKHTRN